MGSELVTKEKLDRYIHVRDRMKERFDKDLSLEDYDLLCSRTERCGVITKKISNAIENRIVSWGQLILVTYNNANKLVGTVMFPRNRDYDIFVEARRKDKIKIV